MSAQVLVKMERRRAHGEGRTMATGAPRAVADGSGPGPWGSTLEHAVSDAQRVVAGGDGLRGGAR